MNKWFDELCWTSDLGLTDSAYYGFADSKFKGQFNDLKHQKFELVSLQIKVSDVFKKTNQQLCGKWVQS